ncbi:unnamed protein product [Trichobilharzia regenti]|nr:unnamed protein product [Trichobilharzia regenti]
MVVGDSRHEALYLDFVHPLANRMQKFEIPTFILSFQLQGNQPDSELDKTQHLINVTQNWARLENLQFGRLYSVVVRAVGEKKSFKDSNFNMNHRNDESRLLFSEWSLEQIFETPEKKPGDSPRDISLIGLNAEPGEQPVSIQISWQPPFHPNGPLTGYFLYYTANHSLPLSEWSKRRLPPDTTNPFGDGPASSVNLYRTPDVSSTSFNDDTMPSDLCKQKLFENICLPLTHLMLLALIKWNF